MPVLVKALADDDEDVRGAAVESVSRFGKQAVPALAQAAKSPQPRVRLAAARALEQMGGSAAGAAPTIWLRYSKRMMKK